MVWNWKKWLPLTPRQLPVDTASQARIAHQPKQKVAWVLNEDEARFNPAVSVVSFRTLGFRNIAHPDSPIEYLEADYMPEKECWRLRQCSVGQGRALSAMFNRAVESSTMAMPTHKSVTLIDRAAFILVLQKMAVYEFGTDTASQYAMREVVEEDIAGSHFMNIAHAAGVIFDVNGHPSMTRNGRPMRDGQYPQSELDHAVAHENAHKPVSLTDLLGAIPLAQENAGLDGFGGFSTLLNFNKKMGIVTGDLKNLRLRFFIETYDSDKGIYAYSDARWNDLTAESLYVGFNYVMDRLDDAANALCEDELYKDVVRALHEINVMMSITRATAMMQCYHNHGGPVKKDSSQEYFVRSALGNADDILAACESFSDERKKMIRGFIMGRHSIEETLAIFDSIVVNARSIAEASQNAEKSAVKQSQVKIEIIPPTCKAPVIEGEKLESLRLVEEKTPANDCFSSETGKIKSPHP